MIQPLRPVRPQYLAPEHQQVCEEARNDGRPLFLATKGWGYDAGVNPGDKVDHGRGRMF